ncbi:MAG: mannose-1-phosphate guanylyltransferase/mannose-6-phosphate isomerase [Granulosicoccus sp.]
MSSSVDKYTPVILAGGSGTRLWPLSRIDYPKQFLSLATEGSLLQETLGRFGPEHVESPIVVCSENHRFLTAEQVMETRWRDIDILLEPVARNTAPAIAVAAWHVLDNDPEGVMLVLPADHLIPDAEYFRSAAQRAAEAARKGNLITFGITPTSPETGFGYIQSTLSGEMSSTQPAPVQKFIEKPDLRKAEQLIASGNCFWNAGIFVFKASVYLEVLERLHPMIHAHTRTARQTAQRDMTFLRLDSDSFKRCDNISVDYAVMEKAENVMVLPYQAAWSDIGSWDAVHRATERDESGNSGVGDVLHKDCEDTYLHSTSRLLVALGTKNISVIETSDAVLIIDNTNAQSIKQAIEKLKSDKRTELIHHTTCYRPWGHYESLKLHPRFQVKRISVKPGAKLSLQKHFHRSEHWVVVKGTAIVTNGDQELLLTENESTYIPLGTMHRLHNPGTIPLELIEVQSGSYLGEDDIVRVGDEYGRAV